MSSCSWFQQCCQCPALELSVRSDPMTKPRTTFEKLPVSARSSGVGEDWNHFFFGRLFWCLNVRPFSLSNFCASLIFQILQEMRQRSCWKQTPLAEGPGLFWEPGREDHTLPHHVSAQGQVGAWKSHDYRSGYLVMEFLRPLQAQYAPNTIISRSFYRAMLNVACIMLDCFDVSWVKASGRQKRDEVKLVRARRKGQEQQSVGAVIADS